ncbi:ABC transporter ATP-binding protein [Actinomycetaceae bacterium L2_0104]
MEAEALVFAHDVVKDYGRFRALDGFNLVVQPGEVHGFCGPNGAGKSTTIRILLGLLRHDAGAVELFGSDPWDDAVRLHSRLAYVPGDVTLWPNLTGGQAIDVLTRLRGHGDPRRRDELIERFSLDPSRKAHTYSKGNRQKVALVAALASDVELLLLDEPTSGLDPLMEEVFTQCVSEAVGRGTSVLLSSHILAEVEKLCDRVTIIRDGRTVLTGTLEELRLLTHTTIEARTRTPVSLPRHWGIQSQLADDGCGLTIDVQPERIDEVLSHLLEAGVTHLAARPPSLEQIFLEQYGGAAR